jgi:hypothetical protein
MKKRALLNISRRDAFRRRNGFSEQRALFSRNEKIALTIQKVLEYNSFNHFYHSIKLGKGHESFPLLLTEKRAAG